MHDVHCARKLKVKKLEKVKQAIIEGGLDVKIFISLIMIFT